MGLKKTTNYSHYLQLEEPFLSYIVTASERCKIEPYLWRFPIIGRVPYLGFATKTRAHQEAEKLKKEDMDVFVRGAKAFSTLGWFDDPVPSSLLSMDDYDLVNTIIHETIHSTLFIESSADFNEALATFWALKGTEQYFIAREGADSQTVKQARLEAADEILFGNFMTQKIQELNEWYKSHGPNCDELERKKILATVQKDFETQVSPNLKTDGFLGFKNGEMNNARLAAIKTYYYDWTYFEKAWEKSERNHTNFLKLMQDLKSADLPFEKLKLQYSQ